jgi:hypothetical protein
LERNQNNQTAIMKVPEIKLGKNPGYFGRILNRDILIFTEDPLFQRASISTESIYFVNGTDLKGEKLKLTNYNGNCTSASFEALKHPNWTLLPVMAMAKALKFNIP